MPGADLYRAHLEAAVLDEADLTGASLVKAELDGASLRGARLDGADFGSVEMYDVDAREASLDAVDLRGADLSDASVAQTFMQVVLDDRTVVDGLTGTVFGPAVVVDAEGRRELSGADLESWLNSKGAKVRVLSS